MSLDKNSYALAQTKWSILKLNSNIVHLLLTLILMSMLHLIALASLINEQSYFKVNYTDLKQARKAFMAFDTSNLQDPPMPPNSLCLPSRPYWKVKIQGLRLLCSNPMIVIKVKKGTDSRGKFYAQNSSKIFDEILKVAPTNYVVIILGI